MMRKLLIAIGFYTRIPVNFKKEVTTDEFYSSMRLMPLVGVIIGGLMYAGSILLERYDADVRGLSLAVFYIMLTGGLHIDGYMDSLDGLMSNRDKAKALEIMKDSRVGAFGALGIIVLFAVYVVFMKHSQSEVLFLMPIAGRCCGLVSAGMTSYARESMDLGGRFVEGTKLWHGAAAISICGVIAALINTDYLVPLAVTVLIAASMVKWIERKIGGTTGDTTGMIIEMAQGVFLISVYFHLG